MVNDIIYQDSKYLVEYFSIEGGLLSFDNLETGDSFMVGIRNTDTGRCIVRGQFRDSLKSHGINKTYEVFKKLAVS